MNHIFLHVPLLAYLSCLYSVLSSCKQVGWVPTISFVDFENRLLTGETRIEMMMNHIFLPLLLATLSIFCLCSVYILSIFCLYSVYIEMMMNHIFLPLLLATLSIFCLWPKQTTFPNSLCAAAIKPPGRTKSRNKT